ncbi:MAG: DNA polymerase III subunit beta [Clostridium sp.]|uniref:DNA polymerase III subunit beta n=1 Tax=Clostridium sp. TaxID=1506 RepID=UPI003073FCC6
MKFTIEKNTFLDALRTTQRISGVRLGVNLANSVLIKAKGEEIILTGGEKNLCIETTVQADVHEEGTMIVDSKIFGEIIRKFPDEVINVNKMNNQYIEISCKRNIANIHYSNQEDFPEVPYVQGKNMFSISQKMLKEMIKNTCFASGEESFKTIFSGVLVDFKKDSFNMVALDGFRAAFFFNPIETDMNFSARIPSKALNEIEKTLDWTDGLADITFTDNHILVRCGQTKIISTLIHGNLQNYEAYIPNENSLTIIINRQSLLNGLESASIIGKEGNVSTVILDIQESTMIITSNSLLGTSRSEIDITCNGFPIEIKFNSRYIIEAINALDEDEIEMRFTNNYSVCFIKNKNDEKQIHLISPIRI